MEMDLAKEVAQHAAIIWFRDAEMVFDAQIVMRVALPWASFDVPVKVGTETVAYAALPRRLP